MHQWDSPARRVRITGLAGFRKGRGRGMRRRTGSVSMNVRGAVRLLVLEVGFPQWLLSIPTGAVRLNTSAACGGLSRPEIDLRRQFELCRVPAAEILAPFDGWPVRRQLGRRALSSRPSGLSRAGASATDTEADRRIAARWHRRTAYRNAQRIANPPLMWRRRERLMYLGSGPWLRPGQTSLAGRFMPFA